MYSAAAQLQDIQTVNWNQVRTATSSDTDMSTLLSIIEEGMPDHRYQLPPQLRDYHQFREHLYSIDGVIIYKGRIVIPPSLTKLPVSTSRSSSGHLFYGLQGRNFNFLARHYHRHSCY